METIPILFRKAYVYVGFFLITLSTMHGQTISPMSFNTSAGQHWADSILSGMTTRQKIAQLFMVSAYTNKDQNHVNYLSQLITQEGIGGLVFFQSSAAIQVQHTNRYQSLSKVPLLIGMDAEWGVGMRLDSVDNLPFQITLGATGSDSLCYAMGVEVAKQFKVLGMHVNFAPVADINSNPDNPVINSRSFGENINVVTSQSIAYMQGMQNQGLITAAKHFPGHGNTDKDSHLETPVINGTTEHLMQYELYPFSHLIQAGVLGIMVGHLSMPAIDSSNTPASLSHPISTTLLQQQMGFQGLVFTDGMQMKAIANRTTAPQANLQALLAGNDLLVFPVDVVASIDTILQAVNDGRLPMTLLDAKCSKVLKAKYWAGLNKKQSLSTTNLQQALNPESALLLRTKIAECAITLVCDHGDSIPLKNINNQRIAYIEVGNNPDDEFYKTASLFTTLHKFRVMQNKPYTYERLTDTLQKYDLVIVGYLDSKQRLPGLNYGIDSSLTLFLGKLAHKQKTILALFSSPYVLSKFQHWDAYAGILIGYNNQPEYQKAMAQALFGAIPIQGKSPVSVPHIIALQQGIQRSTQIRLKYGTPAELGIQPKYLRKIDSIAQAAINNQATPGCQIIAAYKGVVFYRKSFGYHTYQKTRPVQNTDLYDVASVTKVTATLPMLMYMVDQQQLNINDTLGTYIRFAKPKNTKGKLVIKDVLLHQSGLKAWMPLHVSFMHTILPTQALLSTTQSDQYPFKLFHQTYLNKFHDLDSSTFSRTATDVFCLPVARNLFANTSIKNKVYNLIDESDMLPTGYRYSDLGFYYLQRVIENTTQTRLDSLADSLLYQPMGMDHTCYLPLRRFAEQDIVPTEWEYPFRHQLIQGYVHDHGAALIGGVAGHAGLFSNANDMAKLLQMYLWEGTYGGTRYIDPATINEFTRCHNGRQGNRRGLGFDKPEPNPNRASPICSEASLQSYGHSGFTGTLIWIDPTYELIYVFLSNRVYPDYNNNTLTSTSVRTEILKQLINAVKNIEK